MQKQFSLSFASVFWSRRDVGSKIGFRLNFLPACGRRARSWPGPPRPARGACGGDQRFIPPSKFGGAVGAGDPGRLRHDPLAHLPMLRKPVKLRHLRPSLKKFQSGRSSLYSVAYALKQNASAARAVTAHKSQSLLWCHVDQKEVVQQLNEQRRNRPALPEDLSVRIKIDERDRSLAAARIEGFQYDGIEDVFVFLKVKKFGEEDDGENEELNARSRNVVPPRPRPPAPAQRLGIKTSRTSRRFTRAEAFPGTKRKNASQSWRLKSTGQI